MVLLNSLAAARRMSVVAVLAMLLVPLVAMIMTERTLQCKGDSAPRQNQYTVL
jgi:hypothetical protein